MDSNQFKRVPVIQSHKRKREDFYKTTMDIVRHICADIEDADIEEVTWIDSDLGKYSLVIMVRFDQICKRDAVLNAAVAKRPLYTNDIPDIRKKMANQKLSLHKKLPKYLPKRVYQRAKRATGAIKTRPTSIIRE